MKTNTFRRPFIVTLAFFILSINVYSQFTIEASLRPRSEYHSGYKELATNFENPIFIITQRSRLGLVYQAEKIKGKIAFQDVRVWGDEMQYSSTGVFGDVASIDLAEAWIMFQPNPNLSVKIGRQAFEPDDGRILAKRNWNQNGLFYDAMSIRYNYAKTSLTASLSINNSSDYTFLQAYNPEKLKTIGFLHLSHQFNGHLKASVITLLSGLTKTDSTLSVYSKASSGINLEWNADKWKIKSSFYYQYGKDVYKGNIKNALANNFNFQAAYNTAAFTLQAGCSLLSGDRATDATNGKTHLFDLLYGARHKYYGYLDYFSNLRKSTLNGGLNDFYATLGLPLSAKLKFSGSFHSFFLNQKPISITENNTHLGSELDFWVNLNFMKEATIQAGYSFMLPTNTLKEIQNTLGDDSFSSWAWVMISFSVKSKAF